MTNSQIPVNYLNKPIALFLLLSIHSVTVVVLLLVFKVIARSQIELNVIILKHSCLDYFD